jgi:hypothetical protein
LGADSSWLLARYVRSLAHRSSHARGSTGMRPLQGLLALVQAPTDADAAGCGHAAAGGSSSADQQQQQQLLTEVVHVPTGRVLARTMGVGVYYTPSVTEAPQVSALLAW